MVAAMRIGTVMTMNTEQASLPRLFQLISPSLPIGAYSYSQGIEWAAERGWIGNVDELRDWLAGLMQNSQRYLELPLLLRLLAAWKGGDLEAVARWNDLLLASRETRELRLEERQRAKAFLRILESLDPDIVPLQRDLLVTQHAVYALACARWGIGDELAAHGLVWSWLENLVLAAVKILPLGQSEGQRVLLALADDIPQLLADARQVEDDAIGAGSQAQAIASAAHESQYTRLFRS